jgi:hypothetical protein
MIKLPVFKMTAWPGLHHIGELLVRYSDTDRPKMYRVECLRMAFDELSKQLYPLNEADSQAFFNFAFKRWWDDQGRKMKVVRIKTHPITDDTFPLEDGIVW